jgi:hypothetical protein
MLDLFRIAKAFGPWLLEVCLVIGHGSLGFLSAPSFTGPSSRFSRSKNFSCYFSAIRHKSTLSVLGQASKGCWPFGSRPGILRAAKKASGSGCLNSAQNEVKAVALVSTKNINKKTEGTVNESK